MTFLQNVEKAIQEDTVITDIIEYSKEYLKKNEKYVIKYLNKRNIGLKTIKQINTGLLNRNLQVIIPRISFSENIRYVVNSQTNNSLFFHQFKNAKSSHFVGIIRNTRNDNDWRYKILKLSTKTSNFFHDGKISDQVILVEGIFDKLRLMQADLNSIPINGTPVNIDVIGDEFKGAKEIILFLDGDTPAKIKTFNLCFNYLINKSNYKFNLSIIKTPDDLDPCEIAEDQVKTLYKNRLSAEDYYNFIIKNSIDLNDKMQNDIKRNIENDFK